MVGEGSGIFLSLEHISSSAINFLLSFYMDKLSPSIAVHETRGAVCLLSPSAYIYI